MVPDLLLAVPVPAADMLEALVALAVANLPVPLTSPSSFPFLWILARVPVADLRIVDLLAVLAAVPLVVRPVAILVLRADLLAAVQVVAVMLVVVDLRVAPAPVAAVPADLLAAAALAALVPAAVDLRAAVAPAPLAAAEAPAVVAEAPAAPDPNLKEGEYE